MSNSLNCALFQSSTAEAAAAVAEDRLEELETIPALVLCVLECQVCEDFTVAAR